MAKQLYWEDVEVGAQIPPMEKIATTQALVKWAGACGDFNPLHYEDTFAASQGVGKPIVTGQLKRSWLVQMVTTWMGVKGVLRKFSVQFRAMDYPRLMKNMNDPQDGETWRCKGTVTKKYIEDEDHCVDCEVWLENGKGEKTTIGNAKVVLPSQK